LPTTAIYGGNASGKSNFFNALLFAKKFVTEGTPPKTLISVSPFRLDKQSEKNPSRFKFVILVPAGQDSTMPDNQECYEYSFSVSHSRIIEEQLILIKSSAEKTLFTRKDGTKTIFDAKIKNDENLYRILDSTRENQLFLTNAASQNITKYKTDRLIRVYRWFERLTLIDPNTYFSTQSLWDWQQKDQLHPLEQTLAAMETGIVRLDFEDIDI
jgi:AAA15 family ATPase/GTPase